MARNDTYLDTILRHLGAAYYESLHGRATRADVTRALDTVEEHLNEHTTRPPAARPSPRPARHEHGPRQHRWACRVRDVMTTSVVTVDRITPYKEIDRLLTEHKISGMPVLMMGRHVAGVISETDLLAAEDNAAREARIGAATGRQWRWRKPPQHSGLTAGAMMTAPPITIHPDATIPAAARVMTANRISRLPVVDPDGKLIGIVSRRDLLSVFLRPDADITADVQQVLDEIPFSEPADITALVRNGVVTLTGTVDSGEERRRDLIRLAVRLIWDVDGVVDVVNKVGEAQEPTEPTEPKEPTEADPAQTA